MLSLPIYEHNMPLHLSLIYFISIMSFSAYIWCACFIRLILFIFENESIWYHVFYFSFLIFDASIDNVLWSTHMISLHYNILWQQNLFILWCSCNSIIFSFLRHLLKHLINGYRGDKRERKKIKITFTKSFLKVYRFSMRHANRIKCSQIVLPLYNCLHIQIYTFA